MPSFSMVVVGSGGGPDETNLSAYLIKPHNADWEDGITALDAGSGKGALKRIIKETPSTFARRNDESDSKATSPLSANKIYSCIRAFIITHAHLDHISSLVISAGSLSGPRKSVFALKPILFDLENVFDDRLWPRLASWDERDDSYKLLYQALLPDDGYHTISPDISARVMPLSHGHNLTCGVYDSSALFIRHTNRQEFLFFGDVEPDSVSLKPRTIHVWRVAATKFPETLSTIFIECSWPNGRADDTLYGHLSPVHLADELTTLAKEVVLLRRLNGKRPRANSRPSRKKTKVNPVTSEDLVGALDGLRVFVTHCKDDDGASPDLPINHLITNQILAADQGMCIECMRVWTIAG
ncbi:hypothetical protein FIBSPDRAFT_908193 [Athelia psychrophila]|uniref:Cyclic-AMP phosphodiesterase n=1 Tax=Athelia psychrophila TaxID=1759441 RepID=A0A166SV80_9AGAM|nr:hypothetical protein FIBSPDRAFT_908193 [Fibularhizoctonia sp. CBS 109695]